MKKISVIIPNYNHAHLIEKAIISIYQQSVKPYEIIVVDDGSTDESIKVISNLRKKISSLKLITCRKNNGVLRAGMLGVKESSGDILNFRAADDVMPDNSIKLAQDALIKYPESKIVFGEVSFFHKNIKDSTIETLALSDEIKYFSPANILELWKPDFNLPEPACFVSKSALLEQGGLFEEAKWYSGWLCFTSIALKYGLTFIPETLNTFRLNANSYGTVNLRNYNVQRDVLRFLIKQVMSFDRELKEKFFQCGAFTIFGQQLEDLLNKEKESLPKNADLLIKKDSPQDYLGVGLPQYGIPGVISRRLKELDDRLSFLKDLPKPNVIIYGAGTQTLILLEIWNRLNLPAISGIVVSQTDERTKFQNLQIKQIDYLEDSHIDLFILSSKSFELEMAAKLKKLRPASNRISFWVKELTYLSKK